MNQCELIKDDHGWWLQYMKGEVKHCVLMDATNESEAQLEAQEEGFEQMTVWYDDQQTKEVTIPKGDYP